MIDSYAGHAVIHHGGTTNGYQADLRVVPDLGLGWVMLTNCDHHHQLDRVLLRELVGDDTFPIIESPAERDSYVGEYDQVLAELSVRDEDGGLVLWAGTPDRAVWNPGEPPPPATPTRLAFRDRDRVVALDMPWEGHRGEFLRDDRDQVEWFRWDGRISRKR
jgi:hypothetical protein